MCNLGGRNSSGLEQGVWGGRSPLERDFKLLLSGRLKFTTIVSVPKRRSEGLARTRLFHLWGHEPEGGAVGLGRSVSHVVGHGHLLTSGWVPLGAVRARWGSSGTRVGPYLSRTPIV